MTHINLGLANVALLFDALAAFVPPGCGGGSAETHASNGNTGAPLSPAAQLGELLFADAKLSASGKQACATGHVPSHAYTSGDALSVPLGGGGMNLPGFRNAPCLVYASFTRPFSIVEGSVDVNEYNDLRVAFDANVKGGAMPYTPPTFGGGQSPTLSADDINAGITFLCTLTDGFDPEHPSAYALPVQCQAAIAAGPQLASTD
jgi:hypothetical protein